MLIVRSLSRCEGLSFGVSAARAGMTLPELSVGGSDGAVPRMRIPVKLNAGSGEREHGFRRT